MRLLALLVFLLPFSASALPEDFYILNYCSIFKHDGGEVETLPGLFCIPLPDGSVVSASGGKKTLRVFNADNTVRWEVSRMVHHQINMSHDGKRILALISETRKTEKGRERFDKFAVFSLDGKILHEVEAIELLKDKLSFTANETSDHDKTVFEADFERTHFNSIHEIPENTSKLPFMKAGNIIVNTLENGACVLTPDLKTVLDCRTFPESKNHWVHDVQITNKGHYVYFNNDFVGGNLPGSSVDIWDPVKKKLTFRFKANPVSAFFSPVCGGVQMLDENTIMASHAQNGIFVLDRKTAKLKEIIPGYSMKPIQKGTQQYRALKLDSFFKARKQSGK
jgi:hypothetical protein